MYYTYFSIGDLSMSTPPVFENVRKRIEEMREKIKARRILGEGSQGQIIGGIIGGGKIIENVTKSIDNIISMAKERRPNIIPTVMEKIKTYEPGKRIKEIVPIPTSESSKTTTTTGEKKKLLRE